MSGVRPITPRSRKGPDVETRMGYSASGFYKSASIASTDGISWQAGNGDQMLAVDRPTMVEVSRHFYRNNPIYKGMIDRSAAYIVGNGFGLQVRSKGDGYNSEVESLWSEFMEDPEVRGIHKGNAFDRMLCTEVLQTGETINLKTDTGKVQLIESEQLCGKTGRTDGIAKDTYGRPKSYKIFKYATTGSLDLKSEAAIPAESVMFIANRDRPSSTRGVPPLQSTFANLHRINDVCDSVAIAWQMVSRIALIRTQEQAAEQAYGQSKTDPKAKEGDLAQRVTNLGYALMFNANTGETLAGIDHKIPTQNFTESLRMYMRLLGLPFGLPLELILLDWTQSNFSQSRAVLEQVYRTFLYWQELLELGFYRPCLKWKIEQWTAEGRLKPRAKDGTRHEWIKPTFPWINLLEEAKAHGEKVERAFATHGTVCKSLNLDRVEVVEARQAEIEDAIERAQAIEAKYKVKVPWEYFAGVAIKPGQTPPAVQPEQTPSPDNANQNKDTQNAAA
jgi:capsid protein